MAAQVRQVIDGTPRALRLIAEELLAYVANERAPRNDSSKQRDPDLLRRIELCALVTLEVSLFHDLYGSDSDAPGSQVCQ